MNAGPVPGEAPPCPNCGTPVGDRYCPRCGQRRDAHRLSLRRMAADFFDDQFSLNGTLPRTLGALFLRPGFLTREYTEGRIARYVRPFRLFLISSLLFFVALSFIANAEALMRAGGYTDEMGASAVRNEEGRAGPRWDNVDFQIDSASTPPWTRPLVRRIARQQDRLNSLPPPEATAAMMAALIRASARMSFLLVPAFAALLLALHFRRRPRYVEHFVFALHFHAFVFLLCTPLLLIGHRWLWGGATLGVALYLLVAIRRAYAQPWWLAGLKFLVVSLVYPITLSLAIGLASLAAMLLA